MDNIDGVFEVEIAGSKRQAKVTFGLIERLEKRVISRPLWDLLTDAASNRFFISDIATVIHEALVENGDTRLNQDQIGNEIIKKGVLKFAEIYVSIINYALTGGVKSEGVSPEDKKK